MEFNGRTEGSDERELATEVLDSQMPNAQDWEELALSCSDDVCLANDPEAADLHQDKEAEFTVFDEAVYRWDGALGLAKLEAKKIFDHIRERSLVEKRAEANLPPGLAAIFTGTLTDKSQFMSTIRRDSIADIRESASGVLNGASIESVLGSDDLNQLAQLSTHMQDRLEKLRTDPAAADSYPTCAINIAFGKFKLTNPYQRLFMHEIIARAELAVALHDIPEVMQDILTPASLGNLPTHLQRIVAVDVGNGKDSAILKFFGKTSPQVVDLFEYLNNNSVTIAAKEAARAMSLGAKAMGGCDCPMNSVGLCRQVSDAIEPAELPKDIQEDMRKKQESERSTALAKLRALSQAQNVSSWLSFSSSVSTRAVPAGQKQSRKRQPNAASTPSLEKSIDASAREVYESMMPEALGITIKGRDDIWEMPSDDVDSIEQTIDELLKEDMFQKYIKSYKGQADVEDFFRASLRCIFTAESYRNEPSLRQLLKARPHTTADNQNLPTWRLSGKDFRGAGGKTLRDMRIYFGVNNKGGVRRVALLKVATKREVLKYMTKIPG